MPYLLAARIPAARVPLLIVSGSLGTGKSLVLGEASDIVAQRNIPLAAIDLDSAFSWPSAHLDPEGRHLKFKNLACLWANFADAGMPRLMVASVVESRKELRWYREAVPGAEIVTCRLAASAETRKRRLREREPGARLLPILLRLTDEIEATMDSENLADFIVSNEDRPIGEVAEEMLSRAGWLA